jgi:two-component system, NtrC family, sensor kinase
LKDENKTKKQLISELAALRQNITESLNTDLERKGIHPSTNEYELRYRTLFDRSLFCVYLHDLQGNLFDANETALKLFGYTKEELPSLNILSLISEEQRPVALQRIEEILKSGAQKKPFEYMVKKKDGEYLWMEVEGALIVKYGKPYAIQGIARDITERKKAEKELLRIYHEWEDIFHAIGHPTIILDKQHNILSANRATVKAVGGGSQEELLGRKCYEFFHNASEPPKKCPLVKMLTSTKFEESEMEVEALGGVFLVSCTPVFDEKGNVQKIIHIATDITARKRAEESLHASEERFRALTENTSDWIWELDQSFVFTYSSPKVKDLLGYEPNEIIGKTPFDLMPEHEAKNISEISHSIMASRKPFTSFENINLHKDGRQVIIETSGVPIFDKDGNFSGYRGIDRDITERKISEKALKKHERELQKRVKELEEFYDMAVGRELRMKQLKEENEELKEALEKHKKS